MMPQECVDEYTIFRLEWHSLLVLNVIEVTFFLWYIHSDLSLSLSNLSTVSHFSACTTVVRS